MTVLTFIAVGVSIAGAVLSIAAVLVFGVASVGIQALSDEQEKLKEAGE